MQQLITVSFSRNVNTASFASSTAKVAFIVLGGLGATAAFDAFLRGFDMMLVPADVHAGIINHLTNGVMQTNTGESADFSGC